MAWNDKRVSIIILTYKNLGALQRSVRSVCMQNYPHLEIVVTDDGTEAFDEKQIRSMIEGMRGTNIESVKVVHSEINTGTVQNLRRGLEVMSGDYYMTIGSDDALADQDTISAVMRYACLYRWEPLLLTGQLVMCDENLKRTGVALTPEDKAVLRSRNPELLYSTLVFRCAIATVATVYRRDFPKIVDAYDTGYCYYEDYPTFLRMARKGITPVFIDRDIALHPAGGIANGGSYGSMEITERFYRDREHMYQTEIQPYLSGQPRRIRTLLKRRRMYLKNQFLWDCYKLLDENGKKKWTLKHPWKLYLSLEKGQSMVTRLQQMGMLSLTMLCALRASGLFSSWLEAFGELALATGAVFGLGAWILHEMLKAGKVLEQVWDEGNMY